MERRYKILIFIIILILLFLVVFSFAEQYVHSIKQISITQIENEYGQNEEVVISGFAKSNSQIIIILNNTIGLATSDKKGRWIVNLGVLPVGKHTFQVVCNDSENSKSIATASIIVNNNPVNRQSASILDSLSKFIVAGLSFKNYSEKLVTVPLTTPQALDGKWQLVK